MYFFCIYDATKAHFVTRLNYSSSSSCHELRRFVRGTPIVSGFVLSAVVVKLEILFLFRLNYNQVED